MTKTIIPSVVSSSAAAVVVGVSVSAREAIVVVTSGIAAGRTTVAIPFSLWSAVATRVAILALAVSMVSARGVSVVVALGPAMAMVWRPGASTVAVTTVSV